MSVPYEGQEKTNVEKKLSTQKFDFGDSSQSIPSVILSDAVERILKGPAVLHPKDPVRDSYLVNDVFLHMFISTMVCTGVIITSTAIDSLCTQYKHILLTREHLYLAASSCLAVSGVLVLFSACVVALCTDCKLRTKQLANYRMSLKLVFITSTLLGCTVAMAVISRLRLKFDQNTEASTVTRPMSVMGEPVTFENNSIVKTYSYLVHKLTLKPSSTYCAQVKVVLLKAMGLYNSSGVMKNYWDTIQRQLTCCGLLESSDWLSFLPYTPVSCCSNASCTSYPGGCLIRLAYLQAWYSSMMAGTGAIALVVMIGTFFLLLYMYRLEKNKPKIRPSTLSVKSQTDKMNG